ncbi:hypothetical protein NBZ79_05810 [Sneathiella marina]|uniref:Glutamate decarboxylase n=1 Tax=Sneathiella marina TaxID=2950108 RepID=A0ABY4W5M2_9PROT|nr:hypothetical protein [Sneathiella marina]USG62488.1 hypothetical protein NBZ79_05810 [Sneathiella marina]
MKNPEKYTVYTISEQLRLHGWQVPAYAMPEGAGDLHVLRIVIREGFSRDMAEMLLKDISDVVTKLDGEITQSQMPDSKQFSHL